MVKRLTLIVIIIYSILSLKAQNQVYWEGFDNGIPAEYKTYDLDSLDQQPGAFSINYKGKGWSVNKGSATSISFYKPVGKSNDWMITNAISIPTLIPGNKILLAWQESTPDYNYRDSYKVYVGEKDQDVKSFSTILYSSSSTQTSTFLRYITIDISDYANKSIFLAFQNDADDKYLLNIDNITIVQSPKNGLASMSLNNIVYNKVNSIININGNILNYGWDTLRTFQFNYQLDNGPVQKTLFKDLSFPSFYGDRYTSSFPLNVPYGKHTISFWGSEVNGEANQSNISSMNIYGYRPDDYVSRIVLLEQFTSSSCIPCELGNKKIKNMIEELTQKPIVVKYQQDFPGQGDPYCTDESFNRSWYYDINNIPYTVLDGNTQLLNPLYLKTDDLIQAGKREGLASYNVKYKVDEANHSIHVYGSYKPTVDLMDGTRLMIAVKEKLTTMNVSTNDETQFTDVLKKFIPDGKGINLDGKLAYTTQNIDLTYTFPGTYRLPKNGKEDRINTNIENSVEEFSDLAVAVWIENERNHFVLNASEAVADTNKHVIYGIESFKVFPNPSRVSASVFIKLNEELSGKLSISDLSGHIMWTKDISLLKGDNNIDLEAVNSLSAGTYNVIFSSGSKMAVQELIVTE